MPKKNFTRKDLVDKVYQKLGFSKNFSSQIIDNFFDSLIFDLTQNKKIKISSFGSFQVNQKTERIGRNPKTKIETKITARKVVKFKPSEILREKINN
tara:strand:- start:2151 stop:2441 length:291 start_codon:yes stop_codon:yes gene_type:complete